MSHANKRRIFLKIHGWIDRTVLSSRAHNALAKHCFNAEVDLIMLKIKPVVNFWKNTIFNRFFGFTRCEMIGLSFVLFYSLLILYNFSYVYCQKHCLTIFGFYNEVDRLISLLNLFSNDGTLELLLEFVTEAWSYNHAIIRLSRVCDYMIWNFLYKKNAPRL